MKTTEKEFTDASLESATFILETLRLPMGDFRGRVLHFIIHILRSIFAKSASNVFAHQTYLFLHICLRRYSKHIEYISNVVRPSQRSDPVRARDIANTVLYVGAVLMPALDWQERRAHTDGTVGILDRISSPELMKRSREI